MELTVAGWTDAPCVGHPDAWDLDIPDLAAWITAQRTCLQACPMLAACRQLKALHYPRHGTRAAHNPKSMIWAGVAYATTGTVLDAAALPGVAKGVETATAAAGRRAA